MPLRDGRGNRDRVPRTPLSIWIAILATHLLLTAGLALFNPHVHWLDDGFYTVTVARHLAQGAGFTYGGFPTNGVQPLYAFVMTPVMVALGGHPEACVRIALLLMALCSTALIYLLMRLARDLAGETAAVITGLLLVANANLVRHGLSGLETPLHGLLFWLCVWGYLRLRGGAADGSDRSDLSDLSDLSDPSDPSPSLPPWIALGALLALTAYARFDTVFLFFAIAIDLAWRHRRSWRALVVRGGAVFGTALALLTPWFIWSRLVCGSFFQSSGAFHRWRGLVRQDVPHSLLGYVKFAAVKLASLGFKLPLEPLFGYEDLTTGVGRALLGAERTQTGFAMQLLRERPLAAALLGLGGLAIVAVLGWALRRHWRRLGALRPLLFLWPALLGAALFYPLYLLNYSMRHFYPYSVGFALVWGALLAGVAEGAWLRRREAKIAVGVLLGVLLAVPGIRAWTADAAPRHAWDLVRTIEQNVPAGARIGYTDCGVFGYYLPRHTVVNLDGILNFEALREMQRGDIGAYMLRHDVQYVLRLHNFEAEYAAQWQKNVAPLAAATSIDWICRLKAGD